MHDLHHHRQPATRFASLRPAAHLRGFLILTLIVALLGMSPARAAGPATLLRDIYPGSAPGWKSPITDFLAVGSAIYFVAEDQANGRELWKSDGTQAGTVLVEDINPGPQGSWPSGFMNVQGTLFFFAHDGAHGGELWKSDGTPAGTVPATNLPGTQEPASKGLNIGGRIYFFAMADASVPLSSLSLISSDGTPGGTVELKQGVPWMAMAGVQDTLFFAYGGQLWKSDGTLAGTVLVKDIASITPNETIRTLVNVNGTLFFSSSIYDTNPVTKPFITKLWKSDGTTDGTVLVEQISQTNVSSFIDEMIDVNGTLFFGGDDGTHGPELWKSDGTADGTLMLKDIGQDPSFQFPPYQLTHVNGTLFFSSRYNIGGLGYYDLWKSDGTEAGTTLVKAAPTPALTSAEIVNMTVFSDTLFFSYVYSKEGLNTFDLWKSDGTEAGTALVKAGPTPDLTFTSIRDVTIFNGTLFFIAAYSNSQAALWKSDGTSEGTAPVIEFAPAGDYIPHIATLAAIDGMLLFSTLGPTASENVAIWKSDGTTAGTAMISANLVAHPSNIASLTNVNGTVFFTATDGRSGIELWKSNGTPQGTVPVKDINPGAAGSNPKYLTAAGGTLFFVANDGQHGEELWKSDGTPQGTVLVSDIAPGAPSFGLIGLTNVNGTLFFTSNQAAHGLELWKSNGTAAGTTLVKQIPPARFTLRLDGLTDVNGMLFFLTGDALWKSDGTAAGTVAVKPAYTFIPTAPEQLPFNRMINAGGTLFFSASDTISNEPYGPYYTNVELWKSDGTAAGTVMVKDIVPNNSSYPVSLTSVGGTVFFLLDRGLPGDVLWKSDGTPTGTVLVKDNIVEPSSLTDINGTLFFSAYDTTHGRQLWKSDGTTAGTTIVKVLDAALDKTSTQPIVQARPEGGVLFAAAAPNRGVELWQSDGTAEGTILLQDFTPGTGSSNPAQMLAAGNTIFFTVDEPSAGRELWALDRGMLGAMPLARDMLIGTRPGEAISGTLAGIAPDGADVTYTIVANSSNGVAAITDPATGAFTYTPAQGASGRDSFTFKVNDGSRESNTATVTVVFWTSFSSLPLIRR